MDAKIRFAVISLYFQIKNSYISTKTVCFPLSIKLVNTVKTHSEENYFETFDTRHMDILKLFSHTILKY